MTDGKNIHDVMTYVLTLYQDVSRLMLSVDRGLAEREFVPCWGNRCYWGNSSDMNSPRSWAPRSFTRAYTRSEGGGDTVMGFFSLYLLPGKLLEPIAIWGSAQSRGGGALDKDLWFRAMAGSDSPSFLTSPCDGVFRLLVLAGPESNPGIRRFSEALAHSFQRIEYAAVPMLSLTDDEAVRSVITEPLLRSLAG